MAMHPTPYSLACLLPDNQKTWLQTFFCKTLALERYEVPNICLMSPDFLFRASIILLSVYGFTPNICLSIPLEPTSECLRGPL